MAVDPSHDLSAKVADKSNGYGYRLHPACSSIVNLRRNTQLPGSQGTWRPIERYGIPLVLYRHAFGTTEMAAIDGNGRS